MICRQVNKRMRTGRVLPAGFRELVLVFTLLLAGVGTSMAAGNPFTGGWALDRSASTLNFQSIKKGSIAEISSFDSYQGSIDENGNATIRIQLDSIDTSIDLRNVRMRFLFFETFKFPEAIVTASINPESLASLRGQGRLRVPLTFALELHGVRKSFDIEVMVTRFAPDRVSVASLSPLSIGTALFGLDEGVNKLQDAANVAITPLGSVSFDLVFNTGSGVAFESAVAVPPAATAVETIGSFSEEECAGRADILSQTGAIYFDSGSAELDPNSYPLLQTVLDIVKRCPGLRFIVAGHTDSSGGEESNLRLSEARARSVEDYLIQRGISADNISSVGYGESRPIAANTSRRNRERNRRIEFAVQGG